MPRKRYRRHESSGMTGGLIELDYLYPEGDPRKQAVDNIDYRTVEFKTLMESLLSCITENPNRYRENELYDPPAAWIRDVHYHLVGILKLDEWSNLKVVPTLKTSADIYHGIDFMIVYTDPQTDEDTMVTVDISLREEKENYKADVIVSDTGVRANEEYYEDIERIEVPDILGASAQEEKALEEERRKNVAHMISKIIKIKQGEGDIHYRNLATRLKIGQLISEHPPAA